MLRITEKLTVRGSPLTPGLDEFAFFVELRDARIARPSATNMFPAASQATSVGRENRSCGRPAPSFFGSRAGTLTFSAFRPSNMSSRPAD